MLKSNLFAVLPIVALTLGLGSSLSATTVVATPGLQNSPVMSNVTTTDFNNGLIPSNFTFSGNAAIATGSQVNVYKAPTGDTTSYAYAGPGGSITETLGAAGVGVNYFGLLWGSPDSYNTLTFTDTQGNKVVYGQGGLTLPGFTQFSNNPDEYVEFYVTGNNWVTATWTSSQPAFEFDNVTTGVITPEPAGTALIGVGLLALAAGLWRRRRA